LHLRQERVLAEVVLDERGHERIDGLVVGDAGTGSIGERDVALAVDVQEAGHAQQAVAPKHQRIEEIIVDPAVDHVDLLLALGRPHEDVVVLDDEIASLDEHHAHLAGQEGVLEVGGVRHPRGENHHDRLLAQARRGVQQGLE
jgi:hypothetical protein